MSFRFLSDKEIDVVVTCRGGQTRSERTGVQSEACANVPAAANMPVDPVNTSVSLSAVCTSPTQATTTAAVDGTHQVMRCSVH